MAESNYHQTSEAPAIPKANRKTEEVAPGLHVPYGIPTNETGEPINSDNPLYTTNIDPAHRGAANSIFGDRIIGSRVPSIAAQFQYGLRADDAVVDVVGSGTTAFSNSMLALNTGTDANGHIGIQGADYLRYIPGHEAYSFFTPIFAPPVVNSIQRVGLFDFDGGNGNGFFIGYEGLQFGVTRRRAGVDTFIPVDTRTVFPSGSGIFDPTKGNVYKISYGYLGFATIHFEVLLPHGGFVEMASIDYPNTSTETHIANTNIPLRAEITNTGNTTDLELNIGSVSAGIVDGGGTDPIARWFSFIGDEVSVGAGITPLVTFRNKTSFFGLTNKISTQLALISSSTEGVKPVGWKIEKNPTETAAGTWNDVNVDSVMEYSTDVVTTPNTGVDLIPWAMAKSDSFFEKIEDLNIKLRPGETATIFVNTTAANDVRPAMRWKELF